MELVTKFGPRDKVFTVRDGKVIKATIFQVIVTAWAVQCKPDVRYSLSEYADDSIPYVGEYKVFATRKEARDYLEGLR